MLLFSSIGVAATLGVLDAPGLAISGLTIVLGYLGYGFIFMGEESEAKLNENKESETDYQEELKQATSNKEILNVLTRREQEIFNSEIFLNPQNTQWDTRIIDRGEGHEDKFRAFVVSDKASNQDLIIEVNLTTGEITRRSQRLEVLELYDIFENSSAVEGLEKNRMSSSSKVLDKMKQMMQNQNQSPKNSGLQLDKSSSSSSSSKSSDDSDDGPENGILEKDYSG